MKSHGFHLSKIRALGRMAVVVIGAVLMTTLMTGCGSFESMASAVEQSLENADMLMVGLAKVDITPPIGTPMAGYGSRHAHDGGKSQGIHDPLFARVLVLKKGDTSVALVTLDLLYFLSPDVVNVAQKQWGMDHVILNSAHTHSGGWGSVRGEPGWGSLLSEDPPEKLDYSNLSQDPWHAEMDMKIIAAIGRASNNLFPARIGAGQGTLVSDYLAHNRRYVRENGDVKMLWNNPTKIPTSPLDHTVRVLRVDDTSGKCRAILTGFACHAVVLGAENLQISADFPGAMVACIEKEMGPDCMGMFLQGAEGDIDPYQAILSGEEGFRAVERAGEDLAREALRIAKAIDTSKTKTPSLKASRQSLFLGHRTRTDKSFEVSLTTVLINDDIAMVTVPGEPFVQHQIDLAAKSPRKHTLMLGVSYDGFGIPFVIYIPTRKAVAEGGYGADSVTFLEVAAGETIVDQAVATIKELGK